ncbi:MAG: replicative DNA helicase [Vicinamibacterales bacterium]
MSANDRSLPANLEAERSILGAVLLHEEILGEVAAIVTDADFFRDGHRRIFRAMLELQSRRVSIDPTTLLEALARAGDQHEVGGPAYITALVDGLPRSTNVAAYAQIVRQKASLRTLIRAGQAMVAEAYESSDDAVAILERAGQTIFGLTEGAVQDGFESMRSVASRAMEMIERLQASKRGGLVGVTTGFLELDEMTHGFRPGQLIVLGARPGTGKTSLALNIAQNAASAGHPVGFFSLEMGKEELFLRQLSSTARIDSHRIQGGWLADRDWVVVSRTLQELSDLPMHLDETPAISMLTVGSRSRRLKADDGLELLVIDYLQLMGTPGREDNRVQAISKLTSELKNLSKELKVPILLLSQLNRDSAKGEHPRRPQLHDLRESGSIEQDADLVLFLHRDLTAATSDTPTDLIIAKHRSGPVGTIKLAWHEQYTRFDNYTSTPNERELPRGSR